MGKKIFNLILTFITFILLTGSGFAMSLVDANTILNEAESALVYRIHFIHVGGVADYFPASGEAGLSLSDAKEKYAAWNKKNYGRYTNITIKHD